MNDRNPARGSRRAYLALAAVLAASALAYLTLPLEVVAPLAPVAFAVALGSLMLGLVLGGQSRSRARMERGEGVVARWTLDPDEWQEMVRLNGGLVTIPKVPPTVSGGEVVFAQDAVYVAGAFHTMDRTYGTQARLQPSTPELVYIELAQAGLDIDTHLRIPIPPGRHEDAARVLEHFNDPRGR
jgi:hypothetical protein